MTCAWMDSRLRGNDVGGAGMTWVGIVNLRLLIVDCGLGTWIPAYAGMTEGVRE